MSTEKETEDNGTNSNYLPEQAFFTITLPLLEVSDHVLEDTMPGISEFTGPTVLNVQHYPGSYSPKKCKSLFIQLLRN